MSNSMMSSAHKAASLPIPIKRTKAAKASLALSLLIGAIGILVAGMILAYHLFKGGQ